MPNSASLVLNGTSQEATTADHAALDITGSWTIECWFRDESGANYNHAAAALLGKTSDGVNPENAPYLVWIEFNDLTVRYSNGFSNGSLSYNLSSGGVTHNAWHHFAATYTTGTKVLRIYIDGVLVATSGTLTPTPAANSQALFVGSLGTGTRWTGKLDEVRIWNVARTGTEISDYRDLQASGSETGLVLCWHANEGSGTSLANAAGANHTGTFDGTWSTTDYPTLSDAGGGGSDATVNAGLLTLTASLPTRTVVIAKTPALLTSTLTLAAPSVSISDGAAPALLTATLSLAAPTVTTVRNATASPGLLNATLSLGAPAVSAVQNATITPSLLSAALSLPAPSVTVDDAVSPAALVATLSLGTPAVTAVRNATVAPDLLALTLALGNASVSTGGNVAVNAGQVAATFALADATVTAVRNVAVSPGLLSAAFSLATPAVRVDETVSPSLLAATFSLAAPSVSTGGSVTVNVGQVAATLTTTDAAVTATQSVTVTPSALGLTASLGAATVGTANDATVAVGLLVLSTALIGPSVTAVRNATATPSALGLTWAVLAIALAQGRAALTLAEGYAHTTTAAESRPQTATLAEAAR